MTRHSSAADVAKAVRPGCVADLTAQLIRCDTRNPPGDERLIIPVLTRVLDEIGCETRIVEPQPGRPSLFVWYPCSMPNAPVLAINGHTDVVSISREQWSVDPFAGIVEQGCVRGVVRAI